MLSFYGWWWWWCAKSFSCPTRLLRLCCRWGCDNNVVSFKRTRLRSKWYALVCLILKVSGVQWWSPKLFQWLAQVLVLAVQKNLGKSYKGNVNPHIAILEKQYFFAYCKDLVRFRLAVVKMVHFLPNQTLDRECGLIKA